MALIRHRAVVIYIVCAGTKEPATNDDRCHNKSGLQSQIVCAERESRETVKLDKE